MNEGFFESGIDCSPFDAGANLRAVCDFVQSTRQMSWSYAGDIERLVKKVVITFDAVRCILIVRTSSDGLDIFEHSINDSGTLGPFYSSDEGQQWLLELFQRDEEVFLLSEFEEALIPAAALELRKTPCYVFPLRSRSFTGQRDRLGLLLIQEREGLFHWNSLFLESMVLLTDYLSMTLEYDLLIEEVSRLTASHDAD